MEVNDKVEDTNSQLFPKSENTEDSCILVEGDITTIQLDDTIVDSPEEVGKGELKGSEELPGNSTEHAFETTEGRTGKSSSKSPSPPAAIESSVDINGTTVVSDLLGIVLCIVPQFNPENFHFRTKKKKIARKLLKTWM